MKRTSRPDTVQGYKAVSHSLTNVSCGASVPAVRMRLWLLTAALALSGCGGPFPQSTLHPHADFARATDHLFTDIFWWAAGVFIVVELMLVVALVRFRHREGRPAPTPTH